MHRPPNTLRPCTTCAPYYYKSHASVNKKVNASDLHENSYTRLQRPQTHRRVQIRIRNFRFPNRLAARATEARTRRASLQTQISQEPLDEIQSVRCLSAFPEPDESIRNVHLPHRPTARAENAKTTTTERTEATKQSFTPRSQTALPKSKCEESTDIPRTR